MKITYFDAHAHIQFPQFDADRKEVIARMKESGIAALVVGTDYATSVAAVALAEKNEHLFASVGLHPTDVMREYFSENKFSELALHEKVVAIGECGLDYYRSPRMRADKNENADDADTNATYLRSSASDPRISAAAIDARQKEVFQKHVEIAIKNNKALMIHSRPSVRTMDAYEDLLSILDEYKKNFGERLRGNIHFFTKFLIYNFCIFNLYYWF